MDYLSDLDAPLLQLSPTDTFTLRDAFQGVHIFGGIGSGKTSGSGKELAGAYLRAGMGGLVLAAKPDEVDLWLNYAKQNGRSNSVLVFGEREQASFNFIEYELARQGMAGTGSVVECLMRVMDAARLANPNAGRASEAFWEQAVRQMLRNTIPVLYAAWGTVSIAAITRFISSAPRNPQQWQNTDFQKASFMCQTLIRAELTPSRQINPSELARIGKYWEEEFGLLDPKTGSNIAISVSTTLDRFTSGRLHAAFCTDTNILPELTFHGAIIILDMSALTWNEDGIIAQQLFKFMWQRAVLSRNSLAQHHRDRPVFLWADESQYFVNAYDTDFQSACRSSKAATVYLTQSLPTYYAKIGGENARDKADMLLAGFVTKIFHNNACPVTNRWASDTIGRSLQRRGNYSEGTSSGTSDGMNAGTNQGWSSNHSSSSSSGGYNSSSGSGSNYGENVGRNRGYNTGESRSAGYSETMDNEVEPGEFGRILKTGGSANQNNVTAFWFQAGKRFNDSGRNYLLTRFVQ